MIAKRFGSVKRFSVRIQETVAGRIIKTKTFSILSNQEFSEVEMLIDNVLTETYGTEENSEESESEPEPAPKVRRRRG